MGRSLLNRAKISELSKGIFDDVIITNVDVKDRKGHNGPINKMIYIKFAQLNDVGKRVAESELAWWKPDPTSEYFVTNLQEMCLQLHNITNCFMSEEEAFDAFSEVFDAVGVTEHTEIDEKKWKQSEVNTLFTTLKNVFVNTITPFIGENKVRLKLTTNYKGEDIEIPKYGVFVESMDVKETVLKFTNAELKTHSKAGTVQKKSTEANASSTNSNATI